MSSFAEKYVVFKRSEWDEFVKGCPASLAEIFPSSLECFVLRSQDVFAASALHGYAHVIQTALELDSLRGGVFTSEEKAHLGEVVDDIAQLAFEWQERSWVKVPD